jgi:hypothetical protein
MEQTNFKGLFPVNLSCVKFVSLKAGCMYRRVSACAYQFHQMRLEAVMAVRRAFMIETERSSEMLVSTKMLGVTSHK